MFKQNTILIVFYIVLSLEYLIYMDKVKFLEMAQFVKPRETAEQAVARLANELANIRQQSSENGKLD